LGEGGTQQRLRQLETEKISNQPFLGSTMVDIRNMEAEHDNRDRIYNFRAAATHVESGFVCATAQDERGGRTDLSCC
jgi:hypothetical protein